MRSVSSCCRQKVARGKLTMCSTSRLKLAMFYASSGCKQKQAEVDKKMFSAASGCRQKVARL